MEPIMIMIPIIMSAACCFLAVMLYFFYPILLGDPLKSRKTRGKPKKPVKGGAANPVADTAYALPIPKGIGTDCAPGKRGVIGYMNRWKDGEAWMWCKSDPNMGDNDKLSFLSVPQGMRATVYENNYYNGLMKTFEAGEWDLHEQNFDAPGLNPTKSSNDRMITQVHDRVSSIEIEGTPPKGVVAES